MAAVSEARRFTIDPHAIMSLIKAQSGSLQKAMLEAVANSMDAGATRIDITMTGEKVEIRDDGSGLTRDKDIYDFFERFGFDHSQLDRKVGRFGVGRGQLFCFGVNTWRTNQFEMNIDIKKNGLDYDLKKGLPKVPGMTITIDLDEKMQASEQLAVEEEFRSLVRFSTVPVFFNGEQVSEDPAGQKWTHEDEDAWYYVRKDGRLSVYSQGLFVKDLYGHDFGVGGRIVTKPGRALEQNLARNDLLVKECPIWKRIKPQISKLAKPYQDKATKETYITPDMRKRMAKLALTETGAKELIKGKIFTLSNNTHVNLDRLLSAGFVAQAKMFDQRADKLMQRKQAVVLDPSTMERFGVDTVEQLRGRIEKALDAQVAFAKTQPYGRREDGLYHYLIQRRAEALKGVKFFESVDDIPFDTDLTFTPVPYRQLGDEEKAVAFGLRKQMRSIAWRVWSHKDSGQEETGSYRERKLEFFEDNDATQACTDGGTTVWINRKVMLHKARKGVEGFMELIALLVHEQLHEQSSQTSHGHPPEFYEDFHNLLLDGNVASLGLSAFAMSLRHGLKPTVKRLSQLENAGVDVDAPVGTGQALEAGNDEPGQAEPAEPAKPKRRRKP